MTALLDVADVARRTRLSPKTVRAAIRRGELAGHLLANRYRVTEQDYARWLEASKVQPVVVSNHARRATSHPCPARRNGPNPNGLVTLLCSDQGGEA